MNRAAIVVGTCVIGLASSASAQSAATTRRRPPAIRTWSLAYHQRTLQKRACPLLSCAWAFWSCVVLLNRVRCRTRDVYGVRCVAQCGKSSRIPWLAIPWRR